MSPIHGLLPSPAGVYEKREVLQKPSDPNGLILEAWAQGYMVGSLIIMSFITVANMRKGILLHKLILLELILGIWQAFWLFFPTPVDAWWLSCGAIFLNASWSLHNVVSWMKIKPFLSPLVSKIYIFTVILVQPYWIVEIYANFAYFHGVNKLFERTRPWEALCRDPWWIYTTVMLLWTIKTQYDLTANEILRISPRFGIMLGAMFISIIFIILDVCSVTGAFSSTLPVGINPFWKLAFVFKCLTDMVVLDDFKTALDRLRAFKLSRMGSYLQDDSQNRNNSSNLLKTWERIAHEDERRERSFPSPDGALLNTDYFPRSNPPSRHSGKRITAASDPELERHTSHKDSVVAPHIMSTHATDAPRRAPEDMVPSALYDIDARYEAMESAHLRDIGKTQDMRLHEMPRYQNAATAESLPHPSPLPSPLELPDRAIGVKSTVSQTISQRSVTPDPKRRD